VTRSGCNITLLGWQPDPPSDDVGSSFSMDGENFESARADLRRIFEMLMEIYV
jgi:hypothetical protein